MSDLIPVAYALTETDSHIKAMRATRELAAVSPATADLLLEADRKALAHWATLWAAMRDLPLGLTTADDAVLDASTFLASHLDQLREFTERVAAKIEEG